MAEEPVTRKLAAILYTDVAGYSRLTGADEEGTHRTLSTYLDAITTLIERHGGQVLHYAGDAILAEFASVVVAVTCAVDAQQDLADRNKDLPDDRKVQFRIGVNLGDVIVDRDELYGEGVNIAARLEGLANPGGICIAGRVYRQVKGKLDIAFEDLGPQQLKNIAEPVRVFRVTLGDADVQSVGLSGANEPLPLPDKPSIAVLPFDNMSGDPEQAYFADGMAEDIITELSRFRSLFVIARNSTFAYKGKSPDVREVARDLGVRYILEGSVRRGGKRIRITAQLIDAGTGIHLWAERYDRDLDDIFAVQDEVTEAIVAAIAPEIGDVELERVRGKFSHNLDAWGLYQRGLNAYYSSTEEGLRSAIEQFDRVNEMDPTFASAFAIAADARLRCLMYYSADSDSLLSQAQEKARLAIALDADDPTCLWASGRVQSFLGHHEIAISMIEEAIALNPSSAMARYVLGFVLGRAGRYEDAIPNIDHAMRLSPRDVFLPGFLAYRSIMLFHAGHYQEALEWARRASRSPNPRPVSFSIAVAALVILGRQEEAAPAVADLLAQVPNSTLGKIRIIAGSFFPTNSDTGRQFIDALREAGLPE